MKVLKDYATYNIMLMVDKQRQYHQQQQWIGVKNKIPILFEMYYFVGL